MRQVLQSLRDGKTALTDVPVPRPGRNEVLIQSTRSLISSGTERMLVDFGRAGWLEKVRQQRGRVRDVIEKAKTDGIGPTIEAVQAKLDQPIPLGYCNVGTVLAVGSDVHGLAVGDRVVSNGPHAEVVLVPRNLCARVPPGVSDDAASFAVLGAIALQGIRLAAPTLGECFVVTGLGLIGLLTVQLLRANGCKVLGIDPDPSKAVLAQQFGADIVDVARGQDPLALALPFSSGQGVDGVLVTASTSSSVPVSQAAKMCRKRGRIVLVGVAGLALDRADFYQKEISFQVSCSYGPGRYDPEYEEKGHDYPIGFVRWTEQRNFEAVLALMDAGRIDIAPLITHRFAFAEAAAAYDLLTDDSESHLGILLEHPTGVRPAAETSTIEYTRADIRPQPGRLQVAFIGAGNYARRTLLPAFANSDVVLQAVASRAGVTAADCARKFGFARATTDADSVIAAADVDVVVVATRHDSHAAFVCQALALGKHVFVEKPLAINRQELDRVAAAWADAATSGTRPQLMVGFNRRFAPQVVLMKRLLESVQEPKSFAVTVNAGSVPAAHWTHDPAVGGGRLIGEACHFVDLLRFLAGHRIVRASVETVNRPADSNAEADNAVIILAFEDGSMGTIHYLSSGHKAVPKERLEVFCGGRVLQLDNFRKLRGHGWPQFRAMNLWRQNKGQRDCVQAFVNAVRSGGPAPIPFEELQEVAGITLAVSEAARS